MALDILIVDDEEDIRELIAGILEDEGYQTRTAKDSDSCFAEIESRMPSLLVLDIWLQGSKLDGLDILEFVKSRHRDLPVIIISGHGNVETAVAAIKKGAYDFIEKPFKSDQLLLTIERATEANRLKRENEELKKKAGLAQDLVGRSSQINQVRSSIEKVANTNSRVLIQGPSGSGKEVAARLLHNRSHRASGPFVVVSAASMEPHRMEQELFGIEQNGGVVKTGYFERAHGGSLFIDEVADMPATTQAKILRVLTDQSFVRVGGNQSVKVDVRVVSATSRDLSQLISEGLFREDLFHRLNVVPLNVPSLSQRPDDIPYLVDHFIEQVAVANGRPVRPVEADVYAALQAADWPGNVRQLRNVIERMLIMSSGAHNTALSLADLPSDLKDDGLPVGSALSGEMVMTAPLREARETFEREYLRMQINRFGGNISRTASFIGMERSALHRKLKSLGLTNGTKEVAE